MFDPAGTRLADAYRPWVRCLLVIDATVARLYRRPIADYFAAHRIVLTVLPPHSNFAPVESRPARVWSISAMVVPRPG